MITLRSRDSEVPLPVDETVQGHSRAKRLRHGASLRPASLFIVLGSSLVVYPAAALPMLAKSNGAALAIINREPTDMDGQVDPVIHAEIGAVLREIVPLLNG